MMGLGAERVCTCALLHGIERRRLWLWVWESIHGVPYLEHSDTYDPTIQHFVKYEHVHGLPFVLHCSSYEPVYGLTYLLHSPSYEPVFGLPYLLHSPSYEPVFGLPFLLHSPSYEPVFCLPYLLHSPSFVVGSERSVANLGRFTPAEIPPYTLVVV